MDRRTILSKGMMAMAGMMSVPALAAAERQRFFAHHGIPLGMQLYTVHDAATKDLVATLRQLAGIGYRRVELDGLYGRSAAEMRASLDRAGLACPSMHVMGQPLVPGAPNLSGDLREVIANAQAIGATNIVMPLFLLPANFTPPAGADPIAVIRAAGAALTADDYRRMADFINDRARLLAREGLRFGYHNHNIEFAPFGDTTGFDILLRETDPTLVSFELDVGWVAAAGGDPIALLRKHRGRFTQMHVKDIRATTRPNFTLQQDPVEVGSGSVNWKQILPVAYAAGTRNFFVEQEPPFVASPIEALRTSYRYLDGLVA